MMSELTRSTPEAPEICPLIESPLDTLDNKTAQNELLQQTTPTGDMIENTVDMTGEIPEEAGTKTDSQVTDEACPGKADLESTAPQATKFQASKSEASWDLASEDPIEESALGGPSTDLKRKAEEISGGVEKKRKLDSLSQAHSDEDSILTELGEEDDDEDEIDTRTGVLTTDTQKLVFGEDQPATNEEVPAVISRPAIVAVITSEENEGQPANNLQPVSEQPAADKQGPSDPRYEGRAGNTPRVQSMPPKPNNVVATSTKAKGSKSKKREDANNIGPTTQSKTLDKSIVMASTRPKPFSRIVASKTAPAKPTQSPKRTPKQEAPARKVPIARPAKAAPEIQVVQFHLPEIPKIAPTQQRANPTEMVVLCDKSYVETQMSHIERSISTAMFALFQEKQLDLDALPKMEFRPEPELQSLYEAQWGEGRQIIFSDLLSRKAKPGFLRQRSTFLGLIGTSMRMTVFNVVLPWDVTSRLEEDSRYFEQVFNDLGQGMSEVLNYVKSKQIADPNFQKRVVVPFARELAGSLALTLSTHIKKMVKGKKITDGQRVDYGPWMTYLEEAFEKAIILKQTLSASKQGPFSLIWAAVGKDVDKGSHKLYYELGGAARANAKVVHAILPWVSQRGASKTEVYARAVVVAE